MNIAEVFLDKLIQSKEVQKNAKTNENDSFGNVFDKRMNVQPNKEQQPKVKKAEAPDKQAPKQKKADKSFEQTAKTSGQTDKEPVKAEGKDQSQNTSVGAKESIKDSAESLNETSAKVNSNNNVEDVNEAVTNLDGNTQAIQVAVAQTFTEIVESLSQALGLPAEEVVKAIEEAINTPADLLDKTNHNLLIQKAFNAEETAELLNIPNIKEIVQGIEKAVAENESKILFIENAAKVIGEEPMALIQDLVKDSGANVNLTAQITNNAEKTVNNGNIEESAIINEAAQLTAKASEEKATTVVSAGQSSLNSNEEPAMGAKAEKAETFEAIENNAREINITAENKAQNFAFAKAVTAARANVNSADVINQLVEKMKVEVKGNSGEMTIQLKPEHLGDVSLKVATINGIVTAHFVAESQKVKEIIEANFNNLRESLQQQGLQVEALSVSIGQKDQSEQMKHFLAGQNNKGHKIISSEITEEAEDITETVDLRQVYLNNVDYTA